MALDQRAFPAVSRTLRSYLHLDPSDPIDLVLFSAILSNFAPDRLNPLWFVLIAAPESGKSMLLDVLLTDWPESWTIESTLSPAYFLTSQIGKQGVLPRIDREKRRILHMNDMAGLLPVNPRDREIVYTQLIAIYDGHLHRSTGLEGKVRVHKRPPRTRLGWVGAATESFYKRSMGSTFPLGARFTPYYWQPPRPHWTSTAHLHAQRALRGQRLTEFHRVRSVVQRFLDEAVYEIGLEFKFVSCPPSQAARIDAATSLAMRVCGQDSAPPGGRTSDRAVQFARTAAFLHGLTEVEEQHADLAVQMVLSQMHPRLQHLIAYAAQPEQLKGWWSLAAFTRSVGAPLKRYEDPAQLLVDVGVLDRNKARAYGQHEGSLRLSADALKLVAQYKSRTVAAKPALVGPLSAPVIAVDDAEDNDPAEIAMAELAALEAM